MRKIKLFLVVLFLICVILYLKINTKEEVEIITYEKGVDSNTIYNEDYYESDGRFDRENL